MKTAMQEMIQWYQNEHFVKTPFNIQLLNKLESLLEKEKEQIYDAFKAGGGMYDHHEDYYEIVYKK